MGESKKNFFLCECQDDNDDERFFDKLLTCVGGGLRFYDGNRFGAVKNVGRFGLFTSALNDFPKRYYVCGFKHQRIFVCCITIFKRPVG